MKNHIATQLFNLKNKHAVVTGGGSGIGFIIANTLSAAGAKVTIVGRRSAVLTAAAEKINNETGGDINPYAGDLLLLDAIDNYATDMADKFGGVDILVNAAGWRRREPAEAINLQTWRATLDTNLSAPFFLARAFATNMIKRGWGRILNIASLQSKLAFADGLSYGAAKGGVAQLTRAMAVEWSARGVNTNAIAPGFFPTALTAALFADEKITAQLAARTAIGRNGKLEDLAGAALFLCSRASDYITGQILYVDGGFTVK